MRNSKDQFSSTPPPYTDSHEKIWRLELTGNLLDFNLPGSPRTRSFIGMSFLGKRFSQYQVESRFGAGATCLGLRNPIRLKASAAYRNKDKSVNGFSAPCLDASQRPDEDLIALR
jgi:hypothetical protein